MSMSEYVADSVDLGILRDLATRKAEIAASEVNLARKSAWLDLHSGTAARPMVLAEWGGVRDPDLPFAPALQCREAWARGVEQALRQDIWVHEELQDDHVVEPVFNVNWRVSCSGYGVDKTVHEVASDTLSAKSWDAPIKDIDRDFHLLQPRSYSVDREGTLAWKRHLEGVFDGVLDLRLRGGFWWTMGMTIRAIDLIGLENLMLFMYDGPAGLHRLMAFLREDHLAFAEWLEQEGLLSLNNENDYVGSGTVGYTRDLPPADHMPGETVRMSDMWVLLESQETVGVGPSQFEEFIFPYQLAIAERFGLVYYGCCEPVHTRWEVVRRLPHVRAVSVAPLCDQDAMAERLGQDYVFSRKPNPTLVSTSCFDEALIRGDLRATRRAADRHGCPLEVIMKDVHTLGNEPWRLARWVQLAREELA